MITILNRPYDGITAKINPVYNGLSFVVDSGNKQRPNFRYISEIMVGSVKVGELRHNPDISNNNYGMFDLGRVVESYISYNLNWNTSSSSTLNYSPRSCVDYYTQFGEEFSRINTVSSAYNSSGYLRLVLAYGMNSAVIGDRVLISGSSVAAYNGYHKITSTTSGSNYITLEVPFTSSPTIGPMYIIEGEEIKQFTSYVKNGVTYVALSVKASSTFNVGDNITIHQDTIINSGYENLEFVILEKLPYSTSTILRTNIVYNLAISSTIKGAIVSRDNYVLYNRISTINDKSQAYNGVEQYETFLNYNPDDYLFDNVGNNHYLTKRPSKELSLCLEDYYTLSLFGVHQIYPFYSSPTKYVTYETWSTPPANTTNIITLSQVVNNSFTANRLEVVITGNRVSDYTEGSFIDVTPVTGPTYNCRLMRAIFNGTNTRLVLDTPYTATTISNVSMTVRIVFNLRTFPSNRSEIGIGPKNLQDITEIQNGSCYQYKIYTIIYVFNWWLRTNVSETWTIKNTCTNCGNNKKYTMMWLNELGGWDFYNFTMRTDHSRTIVKQNYTRSLKSYNASTGYKYTQGDRGNTNYNVNSKDVYTTRTNYINQADLDWLSFIYESPEVYWIDASTSKIYPVNLINETANLWNKANAGDAGHLYLYEITFELSNERVIQRGGAIKTAPQPYSGQFDQWNNYYSRS